MERISDIISSLPGHKIWAYTTCRSLSDIEDIYWERVLIKSYLVPWHEFKPIFRQVRPGLLETIIEVIIHNAFKHAPNPDSLDGINKDVFSSWEEAVRIRVTFHRVRLNDDTIIGAMILEDNRPEGFDDIQLQQYIIRSLDEEVHPLHAKNLFRRRTGFVGKEERKGQGFKVMLQCLLAQEEEEGSIPIEMYLVHRKLANTSLVISNESDITPLHNVLKSYSNYDNNHEELWGVEYPGRVSNNENQAIYVIMQQYKCPILEDNPQSFHEEYKSENRLKLEILDIDPGQDIYFYRNYFELDPKRDYYEIFNYDKDNLPNIIIIHTGMSVYSMRDIVQWFKNVELEYDDQKPRIWLLSQDGDLQGMASAQGHYASSHEEFQEWCKYNLQPAMNENRREENCRLLDRWLLGIGRAIRADDIIDTTRRACDELIDKGSISDFRRLPLQEYFSQNNVPIDPRIRWILLSSFKHNFDIDAGKLLALKNAVQRLKVDHQYLRTGINAWEMER